MGKKGKSLTFPLKSKAYLLQQIIDKIGVTPIWLNRHLEIQLESRKAESDSSNRNRKSKFHRSRKIESGNRAKASAEKTQKTPTKKTAATVTNKPKRPPRVTILNSIKERAQKLWNKIF